MIYNLTPILKLIKPGAPNGDEWKSRITKFFANEDYDPELLDGYYTHLISNLELIEPLFEYGYLADPYTGLFTFDNPYYNYRSSFNIAYFIERNRGSFLNKKILTVTSDGGIMNVQCKLLGLNLVNSLFMPTFNILGAILVCIGNNSPPYPLNRAFVDEADIVFVNNMFDTSDMAFETWNMMLDMKIQGMEVYFTTQSIVELKKHMIPQKIEPVEDPTSVYSKDAISDLRFGYNHRIYRII